MYEDNQKQYNDAQDSADIDQQQSPQSSTVSSLMDGFLLPNLVVCMSSLVYLAQAATDCDRGNGCSSYLGWAVACAVISMVITLIMGFLTWFKKAENPLIHAIIAGFLVVWWACGAGIGTFKSPYVTPNNGYFAAWVSFIGSCYYFWISFSLYRASETSFKSVFEKLGYSGNAIIFFTCIIYLTAAGTKCTNHGSCTDEYGWAVACSCIGLVISGFIILMTLYGNGKLTPTIHLVFAGFFVVWFACGAGVNTFRAPFHEVGNGYFAAWGTFFASLWYFYEAYNRRRGNVTSDTYETNQDFVVPATSNDADDQKLLATGNYQQPTFTLDQQTGYSNNNNMGGNTVVDVSDTYTQP